ncbi:hypothetical protein TrVE_jg7535 [Triparma verrucosa]|uniref:Methyltransferase type 11 domain-containing protein n=1 Tax=Triparma verrucosa TaxID=1606542 RepID=A0A9W7ETK4_9STRA|nr:hypothetical protein TrVE_jg7535 [Triparma verrucosa]
MSSTWLSSSFFFLALSLNLSSVFVSAGIDISGLHALLLAHQNHGPQQCVPDQSPDDSSPSSCRDDLRMLTLGRQGVFLTDSDSFLSILNTYNLSPVQSDATKAFTTLTSSAETLILNLPFRYSTVDSMDASSYEKATFIHDMNLPLPPSTPQFDFVFDGGFTEHVYHVPQVYQNIINLLNPGGLFLSVTVNNNFSGHGFYQFSPEFFTRTFVPKYGMELLELYLAEVGDAPDKWERIDKDYKYRAEFRFKAKPGEEPKQTYIIAIARKLPLEVKPFASLMTNSPQQRSYEEEDWVVERQHLILV